MLAVVHKRRYTNVLSSEWGERGICMAIGGSYHRLAMARALVTPAARARVDF